MSRFVNASLRQIDLGNDEWVKVPSGVSFKDLAQVGLDNVDLGEIKKTVSLLVMFIKEWNLKINDTDESPAPINEETISQLDMPTVKAIMDVLKPMISVEKNA